MLDTHYRTADYLRFLFACPFFLGRGAKIRAGVRIRASMAAVFPLVNDLGNWPRWICPEPRLSEVTFVHGVRTEGQDAELSWVSAQTSGSVQIVMSTRGRHNEFELELGPGSAPALAQLPVYRVRGRFDCHTEGQDTRLSWRCTWEPTVDPQLRLNDLYRLWVLKCEFARGFARLKKMAETTQLVRP